jgi:hypothetical protein
MYVSRMRLIGSLAVWMSAYSAAKVHTRRAVPFGEVVSLKELCACFFVMGFYYSATLSDSLQDDLALMHLLVARRSRLANAGPVGITLPLGGGGCRYGGAPVYIACIQLGR